MQMWLKHHIPSLKIMKLTMFRLGVLALALSACTDPKRQLMQQLEQSQQGLSASNEQLEPFAQIAVMPPYVYQATTQRSPFSAVGMSAAGMRATAILDPQNQLDPQPQVAQPDLPAPFLQPPLPDASRPRQPLEAYGLSQLIYRGMIVLGSDAYGLVQRPDGLVVHVQVGNYMGGRSGRIVEMTATQVNLVETIFDPHMGYQQVSTSLIAPVFLQ